MTGTLCRLVYCSRHAITAPDEFERHVRAILAAGRRNNLANGITGALLASGGGFAQTLEGARGVVERSFQRIASDPRHTDVSLLAFTPIPKRIFPQTPLAFCGDFHPEGDDPLAQILADTTRGDERAMTGGDLLRLLVRLAGDHDESAVA